MSISATNAADLATTQTSMDAWQYAVIQILDGILPKQNVQPNVEIQRFGRQLFAWLPQKSQRLTQTVVRTLPLLVSNVVQVLLLPVSYDCRQKSADAHKSFCR